MKNSNDYIPYESELRAAREAAAERVKDIPDPRHEYLATYRINNAHLSEKVMAYSIKEAEEQVKQQLSLVGWFPADFKIVAVNDTNVNIA